MRCLSALQVRVATSKDLKEQVGSKVFFDLVDFEQARPGEACLSDLSLGAESPDSCQQEQLARALVTSASRAQVKALRVKKQMLFADFRRMAAEELGVPLERQRWWKWAKRQNGTLRPTSPLADADDAVTILDVCRARPARLPPSPRSPFARMCGAGERSSCRTRGLRVVVGSPRLRRSGALVCQLVLLAHRRCRQGSGVLQTCALANAGLWMRRSAGLHANLRVSRIIAEMATRERAAAKRLVCGHGACAVGKCMPQCHMFQTVRLHAQGGVASATATPTTMDLWLEEPSARSPETGELVFPPLTKQSFLLLVKFYNPAGGGSLRVRPLPLASAPASTEVRAACTNSAPGGAVQACAWQLPGFASAAGAHRRCLLWVLLQLA